MVPPRAAPALLAVLLALPGGAAAPAGVPALLGTAFCRTYGCVALGSLPLAPGAALDLYTFGRASRAELRVWREGGGVTGATYVLHRPEDGGEVKFPVIAAFLSAATGVPVTARDLRRAGAVSPDGVRRARDEGTPPFVLHLLRGGVPHTLQIVDDGVEGGAAPDRALTVRLYRDERLARLLSLVPDVWGLRPVLSFLRGHERAAHGLDRWLDLTPAQRAALDRLVAEDAAFVRAAGEGTAPGDPAGVNTRMTALLRAQDARLRQVLGGQYPLFRAWVRANWASQ